MKHLYFIKKNQLILLSFALLFINSITFSQEISEWRGPGRTGVYQDTNLLKVWPEDGPVMIWSVEGLPVGNSSVGVNSNGIYFTGLADTMDMLIAVDHQGKLIWQTIYGRAWTNSYGESRSTPTIENERVYVSSGLGDIACINALIGEIIWSQKASEDFEGTYGRWGISESLLLVDDKVIYTPCGNKTTMVAYNKDNGELIWESPSLYDNPSYTSPLLTEWKGQQMIISATQSYIIGVDPADGKILWTFDFSVFAGGDWRANNQTNTPIFDDGKVFVTSGYDHNAVQIELSEDIDKAYFNWVSETLDVHHGGVLKIGEYIYGANWENNRMGYWVCLDWNTGEVLYEEEWGNKGAIIAADGMLYCYDEKNGVIGIAKVTPDKFEIISSFEVPLGEGPHWSHPVIDQGILYVRHGGALMAYNIKAE